MATLEQLMTLPGALAAFAFHSNGELLEHRITNQAQRIMDSGTLELMAHMCAANLNIATMQAKGWDKIDEMEGFFPVREWTLIGLEWSVVVQNARTSEPLHAVVIENDNSDYDATFAALEN